MIINEEKYIRMKEARKLAGVSKPTIHSQVKAGKIKVQKIGSVSI